MIQWTESDETKLKIAELFSAYLSSSKFKVPDKYRQQSR